MAGHVEPVDLRPLLPVFSQPCPCPGESSCPVRHEGQTLAEGKPLHRRLSTWARDSGAGVAGVPRRDRTAGTRAAEPGQPRGGGAGTGRARRWELAVPGAGEGGRAVAGGEGGLGTVPLPGPQLGARSGVTFAPTSPPRWILPYRRSPARRHTGVAPVLGVGVRVCVGYQGVWVPARPRREGRGSAEERALWGGGKGGLKLGVPCSVRRGQPGSPGCSAPYLYLSRGFWQDCSPRSPPAFPASHWANPVPPTLHS